ncbi:hypothetical protein DSM106972_045000 [Dulcicalothrix desertica PCC 7102]|uniref:Immunity protein Imm5 domain-containing protein n=1 Tax=Dulcicalothrix desertica PCC 7102 TaxID=232991 RepID=A0A3S1CIM6_9CYAN|nr:Imm5 family immunity protein [Dulcicalothrix desertica]RUT04272.1 hypothetical protein DSM106972_045000 [Dulcicalothrix desertica PCC 7102]TWH38840.1 immunity protein Imm5 of predicted polymorphic toxin system [Dulcicalothrix desertica PCC 7102]
MDIPSKLQELILSALSSVRVHPSHDLNLGYRHAIWAAFGDDEYGHRRRAMLALKTVRHVLPIWNKKFPYDDRPGYILNLAEKTLAGTISVEVAENESERLWREMQQLGYGGHGMVFTVGCAAVAALDTAIDDETFDPDDIDFNLTDNEDTEGNDSSFFAACAYADGAVWKTVSGEQNPIKRLEFWNWWLTQAVPAAWSAVEDDSNVDLVLKTCK